MGTPESDDARLVIDEHCSEHPGRLLCEIPCGPFGISAVDERMAGVAFEEALAHAVEHLTGGVKRRML
jgi:hypothetical protein